MLITQSPSLLGPTTAWLGQPHPFTPRVDLYLHGLSRTTGQMIDIQELDLNGWRVGPDLAEQYANAILELVKVARAAQPATAPQPEATHA